MNKRTKRDLQVLEERRSALIRQLNVTKDPEVRKTLRDEINDMSEVIKTYSNSRSASQESSVKWIGLGIQAAGIALPLWLTNKWSNKWTKMENGELKKSGIAMNPPTTKIPSLFSSISRLWKK